MTPAAGVVSAAGCVVEVVVAVCGPAARAIAATVTIAAAAVTPAARFVSHRRRIATAPPRAGPPPARCAADATTPAAVQPTLFLALALKHGVAFPLSRYSATFCMGAASAVIPR